MAERAKSDDVYKRAVRAGTLANFLYEAVGNLSAGLAAIHRGDLRSALWYLSMGGFCEDKSKSSGELYMRTTAIGEELLDDPMDHVYGLNEDREEPVEGEGESDEEG